MKEFMAPVLINIATFRTIYLSFKYTNPLWHELIKYSVALKPPSRTNILQLKFSNIGWLRLKGCLLSSSKFADKFSACLLDGAIEVKSYSIFSSSFVFLRQSLTMWPELPHLKQRLVVVISLVSTRFARLNRLLSVYGFKLIPPSASLFASNLRFKNLCFSSPKFFSNSLFMLGIYSGPTRMRLLSG